MHVLYGKWKLLVRQYEGYGEGVNGGGSRN